MARGYNWSVAFMVSMPFLLLTSGSLAVAAVLSSLYPVTTVILATVFLRERIGRESAEERQAALAELVRIAVDRWRSG